MAREVIIRISDDLDGSEAAETLTFAYRGQAYEIDLSLDNAELFDKAIDQFVSAARKVVESKSPGAAAPPPAKSKPVDPATKQQRKEIRAWANANGHDVDARGMIAASVIEAYQAANPWVELLPDTPARSWGRTKGGREPVVSTVKAQDGEDGLVSAATLFGASTDGNSRDRRKENRTKAKRAEIRLWAMNSGLDQAATGHLKRTVLEAYYEAHPEEDMNGKR